MIESGLYPAAVTPFDAKGKVSEPCVARLMAWFEASCCNGAVLAGTNGEGPSLTAHEKRDLLHLADGLKGNLRLILGVATCSAEEAIWLCKQAATVSAPVLLMPPFYFRKVSDDQIVQWFISVLDKSPAPILVYNFPQQTGLAISPGMIEHLDGHDMFAGAKDSSGETANLKSYRRVTDKPLFVGNETLLLDAIAAGWSGSISGAANILASWLAQILTELSADPESAETKFRLLLPCLELLRSQPQPATNKAVLRALGIIDNSTVRLPLIDANPQTAKSVIASIESVIGPITR